MKDITLIGFMGCGKSSAGVELSAILPDYHLIDLDDFIEDVTDRSIADIFKEDGEEGFRLIETDALESIFMIDSDLGRRCIISLGGGTVTTAESRKLIRENSLCFYLRAGVDTLEKNLTDFPGNRPMLKTGASLRSRIEELMAVRSSIYEDCADHVIDIDGKTYQEIAAEIAAQAERD
jgi:Shikimate kinase